MRFLLVCCLALTSTIVSAQSYRWIDATGRTIISDSPPPGKAKELTKLGSAPDPDDGLPFAVKRAMEAFPVTLYSSPDCLAECKQARELLNARGVPFKEKMLQKPEDFSELKQLVGDIFVPSLRVGKQTARGFEAGAYNNLLDLAGYPKTAPYGAKPSGGLSK